MLIARKDLPVGNLQEFIAYAKANQTKMQYGSGGSGSATHLACVLLNAVIGVNITHIPYRGGGPAMQDLIAGRIDYQCLDTAIAIRQIESEKIKAIAILARERSPTLPAVASAHEQGLTNFEASNWSALFLPSGTPANIIQNSARGYSRDDRDAIRAGAAEGTRRDCGRARTPVTRLSEKIRR